VLSAQFQQAVPVESKRKLNSDAIDLDP